VIEQLKSFAIAIVRLTVLEQRILEILRVEAFYRGAQWIPQR
jgi:hypothetical protein